MTSSAEPVQHDTERTSAKTLSKDLRERRREMVASMMLSGVARRAMVTHLAQAGFPVALGTVQDDVNIVRKRWRERAADSYEEHVADQMAILDGMQAKLMPKVLTGDLWAMDRMLAVLDRRERLLGLDLVARARASIEERMLSVEQAKVALVAKALEAAMGELGVAGETWRPIISKHLKALEGGGA